MARFIEKNEIESEGPWLLTKQNLEELDSLFHDIDILLQDYYNLEINQEVNEEANRFYKELGTTEEDIRRKVLESYNFRIERKAIINTEKNETLEGSNLIELLRSRKLESVKPKDLKIQIKKGTSEVYFTFSNLTYFGGIKFIIKVENEDLNERINYSVKSWIEKNKPKQIIKIWSRFGPIWAFVIYLFIFFLYLIFANTNTPYDRYHAELIRQANIILDSGVRQGEERTALEILLKLQAGYIPKKYYIPESKGNILSTISIVYLVISILLNIGLPKPLIGLGLNTWKANFRKWWYPLVTLLIPSFILSIYGRDLLDFFLSFVKS